MRLYDAAVESTPIIVPISELRMDAAGVLRQASAAGTPVYVTQRGRLAAVLLARPMYERLIREHEILSRTVTGDLDVHLVPGVTLEEVLRRGERALQEERLAAARELAAEARRLEEREREPPVHRPECTLGELMQELGVEASWPGARDVAP